MVGFWAGPQIATDQGLQMSLSPAQNPLLA